MEVPAMGLVAAKSVNVLRTQCRRFQRRNHQHDRPSHGSAWR